MVNRSRVATVRFPASEYARLAAMAISTGISFGALIRRMTGAHAVPSSGTGNSPQPTSLVDDAPAAELRELELQMQNLTAYVHMKLRELESLLSAALADPALAVREQPAAIRDADCKTQAATTSPKSRNARRIKRNTHE